MVFGIDSITGSLKNYSRAGVGSKNKKGYEPTVNTLIEEAPRRVDKSKAEGHALSIKLSSHVGNTTDDPKTIPEKGCTAGAEVVLGEETPKDPTVIDEGLYHPGEAVSALDFLFTL